MGWKRPFAKLLHAFDERQGYLIPGSLNSMCIPMAGGENQARAYNFHRSDGEQARADAAIVMDLRPWFNAGRTPLSSASVSTAADHVARTIAV